MPVVIESNVNAGGDRQAAAQSITYHDISLLKMFLK